MARNLVWKTWHVLENMLELTLNDMQQSDFVLHAILAIPSTGSVLDHFVIIGSRVEAEAGPVRPGVEE